MRDFLFALNRALQVEHLVLQFQGSKGAGPLAALLMCLCPDDVKVEVEGELIHQGIRSSVVLSIIDDEGRGSQFRLESRLQTHSEDFRVRHIVVDESTMPTSLTFKWHGWLSSCLEIALGNVRGAVANLLTAAVTSVNGSDRYTAYAKNCQLPKDGLRTLLGPDYEVKIRNQIKVVLLAEPSESNSMDLISSYNNLKAAIASVVPTNACTCNHCANVGYQWDYNSHPKSNTTVGKAWGRCRVAQLWSDLGDIVKQGISSLFVTTIGNPAVMHVSKGSSSSRITRHQLGQAISRYIRQKTSVEACASPGSSTLNYLSTQYLHHSILSIVEPWPFSHFGRRRQIFYLSLFWRSNNISNDPSISVHHESLEQ